MARGHSQSAASRAKIATAMIGNNNAKKGHGGKRVSTKVSTPHVSAPSTSAGGVGHHDHDTLARNFVAMHGTAGAAAKAKALVSKKKASAKDKALADSLIRAIRG